MIKENKHESFIWFFHADEKAIEKAVEKTLEQEVCPDK